MSRVIKMCQFWFYRDVNSYQDERAKLILEFGDLQNTEWGRHTRQLDAFMETV